MKHNLKRLYCNILLKKDVIYNLNCSKVHYLKTVLRLKKGDYFRIFNEVDGEYIALINDITRNCVSIILHNCLRKPVKELVLILGLCIIKANKMEDAIDMAVQLGISEIVPLIAQRSQMSSINYERIMKCIIRATEQSERLQPPILRDVTTLTEFCNKSEGCTIIYANENEIIGNSINDISCALDNISLIIGPEGGFSEEERIMLSSQHCYSISLGTNILRSETAVVTALAEIQLCRRIKLVE
jgi:16S rRNA (uracil1498-N3)-methyltransferase